MFRTLITVVSVALTTAFGQVDHLHNSPRLTLEFSSGKTTLEGMKAIDYLKRFGMLWTPYTYDPRLDPVVDKLYSQTATAEERAVLDPLLIAAINPGREGFGAMLKSMGKSFAVPGGGFLETLDVGGDRGYPRIYGADAPSPAEHQAATDHVKKFSKLTACIGTGPAAFSVDQWNFFLRGPESEWFFAVPDGNGEVIKVVSAAIEKGMAGWVAMFSAGDVPHGAFATGNPGITVAYAVGPPRWAVFNEWSDVPIGNPAWVMHPWGMGDNPWVDYTVDPPAIATTPLFDPIPDNKKEPWLKIMYSSGKPNAFNYDAITYLASSGILFQPHVLKPELVPIVDMLYHNNRSELEMRRQLHQNEGDSTTGELQQRLKAQLIEGVSLGRVGFGKTLRQVGRAWTVPGGGNMVTSEAGRVYPRVYVTPPNQPPQDPAARVEHVTMFGRLHVNMGVENKTNPIMSYAGVPEWDFFLRGRETNWFFALNDGDGEVIQLWFRAIEKGPNGYMLAFPAYSKPHGAYPQEGTGGVTVAFSLGPSNWEVINQANALPPVGASKSSDAAREAAWALGIANPWIDWTDPMNPTLLDIPKYSPSRSDPSQNQPQYSP